jgi:hypothetical protein
MQLTADSRNYLYVFVDEAGDFNFSSTGTKYFTLKSGEAYYY